MDCTAFLFAVGSMAGGFCLGVLVYRQGWKDRERKEKGLPPEAMVTLPKRPPKREPEQGDDVFRAIDRFGENLK